jgi:hypothetical protein
VIARATARVACIRRVPTHRLPRAGTEEVLRG